MVSMEDITVEDQEVMETMASIMMVMVIVEGQEVMEIMASIMVTVGGLEVMEIMASIMVDMVIVEGLEVTKIMDMETVEGLEVMVIIAMEAITMEIMAITMESRFLYKCEKYTFHVRKCSYFAFLSTLFKFILSCKAESQVCRIVPFCHRNKNTVTVYTLPNEQ